jgi:hypothetical protein
MTSATTPILIFGHNLPHFGRFRRGKRPGDDEMDWLFGLFGLLGCFGVFRGCRIHRGEGPVTSMEDLGFLVQVELLFGPGSGAAETRVRSIELSVSPKRTIDSEVLPRKATS